MLSQHKESSSVTWFPPYQSSKPDDAKGPFASPNLALNNSASELLRKLQHKVQRRESNSSFESAFENVPEKENEIDYSHTRNSLPVFPERQPVFNS